MEKITLRQTGRWLAADFQTPISLYLGLVGERPGILLESAEVDGRLGRYSLIAWDFRLCLTCREGKMEVLASDSRVAAANRLHGEVYTDALSEAVDAITILPPEDIPDLPPITRALYGYFGYGLAGLFEEKLGRGNVKPEDAESSMVLPASVVLFDHLKHRACYLSLDGETEPQMDFSFMQKKPALPAVGEVQITPGREKYMEAVETAKELIRQGECIQTVLSNRFSARFAGDPFVVYRRLRQINPSPYMFFMKLPGIALLGSSPEMLVRCTDGKVETCPIAGTRPRGENAHEDEAYARDLLDDPKERAEHVMLVDLGRNDLGRIAKPGTVSVEKFMQVEKFSHVMHLTSYVQAEVRDELKPLEVLASCFPAGTLSGAPKVRAMEIIAELEGLPRGPYGGAIGWLGLDAGRVNLDTGITIRSLWVRDGRINWQAGAGIVFDSVPEKEWEECLNKAKVMKKVLNGGEKGDVFAY